MLYQYNRDLTTYTYHYIVRTRIKVLLIICSHALPAPTNASSQDNISCFHFWMFAEGNFYGYCQASVCDAKCYRLS